MENDRIASIDIVRGIVMIIMPLDHVRDLLHESSLIQSPTDLATTTPILFFTRWITYLCAPAFVFLAGASVYRMLLKKNDPVRTRSFLIKRGVFLIALEFLVVNTIIYFDLSFHNLLFEVIAAIGFGFIVLSFMLQWRLQFILLFGLIIIFLHNALLGIPDSIVKTVLSPFFAVSQFPLPGDRAFTIAYPPIPWLGIMLTGFAAGKVFDMSQLKRVQTFLRLGWTALLLFVVLRMLNIYGDPSPWSFQKSGIYTGMSFINVSKYPPSLLFSLVTLGIMFLLLAYAEKLGKGISRVISVYGKVPLFYFIVHFLVIHILLLVVLFWQGFSWSEFSFASGTFGRPTHAASGLALPYIFVIWLGIVVILYRPCIWFYAYKQRSNSRWIKYL
jgi:uncharacterized membrane protein